MNLELPNPHLHSSHAQTTDKAMGNLYIIEYGADSQVRF